MKICMLAPEFIPVWGGVGTYIGELVRHLPKDIEVHVVTPQREGFGKRQVSNTDYSQYFDKKNIIVHFISNAKDTFFYNGSFQYACLRYVPKLIKEENIDLIHSHTAQMPDLMLMFRNLDTPTIVTTHTTIKSQRFGTKTSERTFFELERSEKITYLLYPLLRGVETVYFKRNMLYISPSHWMKNALDADFHINKRVRVIPNSLDLADYPPKKKCSQEVGLFEEELAEKKIILYVGRLIAMKGVNDLLDSIPHILKWSGLKNLLFVFAGPGDRSRYATKTKEMRIDDHCLFTGPLSKRHITQLMFASQLVVVPSLIENTPYTILESMACGVPVVASNVGGVSEIIENWYNGILIEPKSPRRIALAVIRLLKDEQLRISMGEKARETVS